MKRADATPDDPPVFAEPWEAQAFAIVHELHAAGHLTWAEWTTALGGELAGAPERAYYLSWVAALEKLASQNGLTREEDLHERVKAWREDNESTVSGQSVE